VFGEFRNNSKLNLRVAGAGRRAKTTGALTALLIPGLGNSSIGSALSLRCASAGRGLAQRAAEGRGAAVIAWALLRGAREQAAAISEAAHAVDRLAEALQRLAARWRLSKAEGGMNKKGKPQRGRSLFLQLIGRLLIGRLRKDRTGPQKDGLPTLPTNAENLAATPGHLRQPGLHPAGLRRLG
jgi:hypothetical protein